VQQVASRAVSDFAKQRVDARAEPGGAQILGWFAQEWGCDYVASVKNDRVRLQEAELRAALWEVLARPSAAIVSVTQLGESVSDVQALGLRTSITEALVNAGTRVIAQEWLDEGRWRSRAEALCRGDTSAASALGLGFLADLCVYVTPDVRPSQNNGGIISAIASCDVRCVGLRDGRVVFARHFGPEKGFGLDLAQASNKALDQVSPTVVAFVAGEVAKYRAAATREIKIRSPKPLPSEKWEALQTALRECKSVRETTPSEAADGGGGLTCKVEGSPVVVAAVADATAGLKVMSCDESSVVVAEH